MFKIIYESDHTFDLPQIHFNYIGEVEFQMNISGDSLFDDKKCTDWIKLVEDDKFTLQFGDSYGSHVDNGVVEIRSLNSYLEFEVDGARGGDIIIKIPKSICKNEFYKLADIMQKEFPKFLQRRRHISDIE